MDGTDGLDVVVAGGGPVGLMLAAELRAGGASVLVAEREPAPCQPHKAGAMGARALTAPTVAALAERGLLPAVRAAALAWFDPAGPEPPPFAGHFAGIPVRPELVDPAAVAGSPGGGVIAQQDLETVLAAHAAGLGAEIRRGVAVTGFRGDGGGVTVTTTEGEVRAGWLAGCDGGRSLVRKHGGFDFPGTGPEFSGLQAVVDADDPGQLAADWTGNEAGSYIAGGWQQGGPPRVHIVEYGASARRDAPVTPAEVQQSLRRVSGTSVTITKVHAATRYTDTTRQASTYRRGRVLLAGDAAHVHSPAGGQGLNLGIGDAISLGAKLAAVVRGAGPALLDTYTAERHPAGAWVQAWSMAQTALGRRDQRTQALRGVVADLINTRDGATYVLTSIAGLR
jgi:2-polyprenyl-6-methoxyphenol hydroxylase-like FAD-dependent oxidoreductase